VKQSAVGTEFRKSHPSSAFGTFSLVEGRRLPTSTLREIE